MTDEPQPSPPEPPPEQATKVDTAWFDDLLDRSLDAPKDDALAKLEEANEKLRDAIKEERFCWILLCMIIVDMAVFANVQTTGVPIAILVLQAIFLVVVAKKLGVEQVVRLMDRVIEGWTTKHKE